MFPRIGCDEFPQDLLQIEHDVGSGPDIEMQEGMPDVHLLYLEVTIIFRQIQKEA